VCGKGGNETERGRRRAMATRTDGT
jgi:hypothetical protein